MAVECDLRFPHRYEIEEVPELPGSGRSQVPVHYFPGSRTRPEQDGLWLMIQPSDAEPWIGVFAPHYGCTKVLSLPDPDSICVVSGGSAYLVKASDPETWQELQITPVTDVRAIPEAGFVIFADFCRLTALGREGIAWRSPRLCDDSLKISRISSERIEGVGYDPGGSGKFDLPFAVEAATGRAIIPPPPHLSDPPYA